MALVLRITSQNQIELALDVERISPATRDDRYRLKSLAVLHRDPFGVARHHFGTVPKVQRDNLPSPAVLAVFEGDRVAGMLLVGHIRTLGADTGFDRRIERGDRSQILDPDLLDSAGI